MKLFTKTFTLFALIVINICLCGTFVRSEDDIVDDNDEDAIVNDSDSVLNANEEQEASSQEEEGGTSPYAQAHLLFIQPESLEFPAGKTVRLAASLRNTGNQQGFLVEHITASLRYPQDFQYHIQNFSTFEYYKLVKNEQEATFEYAFTPSDVFAGRPFGLVVTMQYRNHEERVYTDVLFNNTINIVDMDEGLDGETFFLYIFLAAIVVVLVVVAQHYFSSAIRKRVAPKSSQRSQLSSNGGNGGANTSGNANTSNGEIDYEWIPKEHLQQNTPRTSPRLRQRQKDGTQSEGESATTSK